MGETYGGSRETPAATPTVSAVDVRALDQVRAFYDQLAANYDRRVRLMERLFG